MITRTHDNGPKCVVMGDDGLKALQYGGWGNSPSAYMKYNCYNRWL